MAYEELKASLPRLPPSASGCTSPPPLQEAKPTWRPYGEEEEEEADLLRLRRTLQGWQAHLTEVRPKMRRQPCLGRLGWLAFEEPTGLARSFQTVVPLKRFLGLLLE